MGVSHLSAGTTQFDCNTVYQHDVQILGHIKNIGKKYNNKKKKTFEFLHLQQG